MKTTIIACLIGSLLGCTPLRTVTVDVPLDPTRIIQPPPPPPGCGGNPWTAPPDQGVPSVDSWVQRFSWLGLI